MWGSQVRMQPGSRVQAAGAGGTHHWAAKWFGAPGSPAPSTAAQSPGPQRQCSPLGHWRMRGPPPSRPALWRQRTDRPSQITADPCCWLTGGWHLTALGAQGLLLWWPGFAWPTITQGGSQRHWGRDPEPEAESLAGAFSLSQDTPGLGVLRTRLASSPPGHKSPPPHSPSCLDFHYSGASAELLLPPFLALFYFLVSFIVFDVSLQTMHTFFFFILKILGRNVSLDWKCG